MTIDAPTQGAGAAARRATTGLERILAHAERTPDRPAVLAEGHGLNYAELIARTRRIAAHLSASGVGCGDIVAVAMDRTIDMVPSLLGILWCGAAYLPLNPEDPPARIQLLVNDTKAAAVLTDAESVSLLPALELPVLLLPEGGATLPRSPAPVHDAHPAYLIYTSGSTGMPKGVVVARRNLAEFLATFPDVSGISAADRLISVAAYSFDFSVGDIFGSLAVGALLVVASRAEIRDPQLLAGLLAATEATRLSATPTLLSSLLRSGWRGVPGLTITAGGETLTPDLASRLLGRGMAICNAWGPTEATVFVTCGMVAVDDIVTIGTPMSNCRLRALNEQLQPCLTTVAGELVIGGPLVTHGYLNRPGLTATRFVADLFGNGTRMYYTGDQGRELPDGRFQHLGRLDRQLKIRGYRIEPGEIEAVLLGDPDIDGAVIDTRADTTGAPQLVAYLQRSRIDNTTLRSRLRHQLPAHLIPTLLVDVDSFPTTTAGKLDWKALAELPLTMPEQPSSPVDEYSPTERALLAMWSVLLGRPVASIHDNFFDVGGHSVLAAELLNQIRRQFDTVVSLTDFVEHGLTVAGLARLVTGTATPARYGTRLFIVYPDPSSAVSVRHLAAVWGNDINAHVLLPMSMLGRRMPKTVAEFAALLVDEIRAVQPEGPYRLAGFSFGGMIAYELARLLTAAGETVEWTCLIDSPTPQLFSRTRKNYAFRRLLHHGVRYMLTYYLLYLDYWSYGVVIRMGLRTRVPNTIIRLWDIWPALSHYRSPGITVPLTVLYTEYMVEQVNSSSLGWAELHRGPLTMIELSGNHQTILDAEHAHELAHIITCAQRLSSLRCRR